MFHDWLKLLANLSANNYCTKDFICPECGKKSIDYRYVGDVSTRIGYLPIWCKNCNKGIKMIEFGDLDSIENTIPNFKHVMD